MADARPARLIRPFAGSARRRVTVIGSMAVAAAFVVAMTTAAEFDAAANANPTAVYLNDAAGSVVTFTVSNTGTSVGIGAVQIRRPDSGWGTAACEAGPAGWTTQRADPFCRYRSAEGGADDIQPGASAAFAVRITTAPGSEDRLGTFQVVVSRSNQFDNPSLLTAAAEGAVGLDLTAHAFEVLDAVVAGAASAPGSTCPPTNKSALVDATAVIVICGRNRSSVALTPSAAQSTLGGTFLASPGAFASGSIPAHSASSIVLGNWTGATVRTLGGTGLTIDARIAASATQTSPLTTLGGFVALNNPPVAGDDGPYAILEDGQLTVAAPGVLTNDSDPDGHPLTAALAGSPSNGSASVGPDGAFSYEPDADFFGSDSFTYSVGDGHGGSAIGVVSIDVASVNDVPTFTLPSASDTSNEDAGARSVNGFATGISAGPANEASQGLSFTLVVDNPTLFATAPAIDAGGRLTYEAAPDGFGSATVTATLSDDGGTATGGIDTSAPQQLTVVVNPVNDAPSFVLPADPDQAVAEDSGPQTVTSFATAIAAGPANEVGQSVHFDLATDNDALFAVQPAIAADGTLSYTPADEQSGAATVTVSAQDDGGTASGGVDTSTPRTFTITVTGVNDPPSAIDHGFGTAVANTVFAVGRPTTPAPAVRVSGNLLDGSYDPDGPAPVEVVAGPVATTGGGTATLHADGTFTYLSAAGFTGTSDSFTYRIRDGAGADSAPATVEVDLSGDVVWYVDNAVPGGGDGRSTSPFSSLAALQGGADPDDAGDILFVHGGSGVYAGGFVLETGQRLIGEPAGLTLVAQTVVPAAGSRPRLAGAAGDGLSLAAGASVASIEVADSALDGIAGTGLTGTVSLSDVLVHGSGRDNARLSAAAGVLVFSATGSTFRDNDVSTGGHGLRLIAAGTSNVTATVSGSTFRRNRVAGIQAVTEGAGNLTMSVTGGTFDTNFNGLDLIHASSAALAVTASGNDVSTSASNGGAPINLFLSNRAGSGAASVFRATITDNVVSNNGSASAPGIWYHTGTSAGHARLLITGNDVSGVAHRGIAVEAGPGSSSVDATISGNSVALPADALDGIFVQSGVLSTDSVAVCADITSNTVASPLSDIRVRQRFAATTLRLPGYLGGGTDAAAVEAFLAARNPVSDVRATHDSAAGFGGGGGCATP